MYSFAGTSQLYIVIRCYTNFVGALIEIGSTDVPTTIIVRDNKSTSTDYTINVTTKQGTTTQKLIVNQ